MHRFKFYMLPILLLIAPLASPAFAQISQGVKVCNPDYPNRCQKPDTNGAQPVTVSSITGTSDVNLKPVNGATINVGVGAAGTGTQRITTSTDSTIATITNPVGVKGSDGSAIASSANPVPQIIAPSSSSTYGVAPASSTTAEACRVLKASAGNLYSVSGYTGAAAWIMGFNATSAPADGAVTPVVWAYAPAAGSFSIDYGAIPAAFSTGITFCISSTGPLSKTAVSTNNVFSGRVQ